MKIELGKMAEGALSFLEKLYCGGGFYKWSLNADIYGAQVFWGLGNAVFAVKIYFVLNKPDKLPVEDTAEFIYRFENSDGSFYDKLVQRKASLNNKISAIKRLNFSNFFGNKNVMAETRQAVVALKLLGRKPNFKFNKIPYSLSGIEKYIDSLDWGNIWSAASHLGHLIFFLKFNAEFFGYKREEADVFINRIFSFIESLQSKDDGMWGTLSLGEKIRINGAMKIISSYVLCGRNVPMGDKIIDYVIDSDKMNRYDGCDNLNAVFVLRNVFLQTDKNYRVSDIKAFAEESLDRFMEYYIEEEGGFSFVRDKKDRYYYGAKITKRFYGADIHGTFLLLWAMALALDILGDNSFNPDILN